jgi:hypothetical protein
MATPKHRDVEHGAPVDRKVPNKKKMEEKNDWTLHIVIASITMVAVFGCAIIGGLVTGDDVFFVIIGIISAMALMSASIVGLRAYCDKSLAEYQDTDAESSQDKESAKVFDLRGTFTKSEDEDHDYYNNQHPGKLEKQPTKDIYEPTRGNAHSVFGEMSALSPRSFEGDSAYQEHQDRYERQVSTEASTAPSMTTKKGRYVPQHTPGRESSENSRTWRRGAFDFASVASTRKSNAPPRRADPPEQSGSVTHNQPQVSREPAAHKMATDGHIVVQEYEKRTTISHHRNDEERLERSNSPAPATREVSIFSQSLFDNHKCSLLTRLLALYCFHLYRQN